MALDLTSLRDQEDLTTKITLLTPDSANALATTALQLHEASGRSLTTFLPDKLTVLSPTTSDSPDSSVLEYLRDLTVAAEKAAISLACSSILVGQSSESDYLGDVGIWLGPDKGNFGPGRERALIKALGLEHWTEANITPVDLETSDRVPPSVVPPSAKNPEVKVFIEKLKSLEDRQCFRLTKPGSEGSVIVFFLLGKINGKDWGGLVGMGTWSDE